MDKTALGLLPAVVVPQEDDFREDAHFRLTADDDLPRRALPRAARNLAAERLALWGLDSLVEDVRIITSELVTNAIQHAPHGHVRLTLRRTSRILFIEVEDQSPRVPVPRGADPDDESGRGLHLIRQLCDEWGYGHSPEGSKTTWCSIRTAGPVSPGSP